MKAWDRALVKDEYLPRELALIIDARGSESTFRLKAGWIRTVLREGLRGNPAPNVHLLISKRDARRIWIFADEWYNRPNRPSYDVWLDEHHHLRPQLLLARAAIAESARRAEPKKISPRDDATIVDALMALQSDMKKVKEELEDMKSASKPKKRKQVTTGIIIDYVSPIRRRIKKLIDSAIRQWRYPEGPRSEDYRDTWTWLRSEFEQATGGGDSAVYRGQIDGDTWIAGIETAGVIDLFAALLPDMLSKRGLELANKQQELFR